MSKDKADEFFERLPNGEWKLPSKEYISKPFTDKMRDESNINRDVPAEVYQSFGILIALYAKTEVRLNYILTNILPKEQRAAISPFWDRYSLLKRLIRYSRKRDFTALTNLCKFMSTNRRIVSEVRRVIAHCDMIGMLNEPPGHIRFVSFPGPGQFRHEIIDWKAVAFVIEFLGYVTRCQGLIMEEFEQEMKKFMAEKAASQI